MWFLVRWMVIAGLGIGIMVSNASARDLENTIYLDLKDGRVVIELRPDLAPNHVARIKELTRQGFYDGLKWHRVIDGFMAQTGDPKGLGIGGSGQNIKAEFSSESHVRGSVSMARSQKPDSADSQFFIALGRAPNLEGKYTVIGKVIHGLELADSLKTGRPPKTPDKIVQFRVGVDAK